MQATKILWGQIIVVSLIVLGTTGRRRSGPHAARLPAATRRALVRTVRLADLLSAGLLLVVVSLRRLCAARSSSRAQSSRRRAASSRSPSRSSCRSARPRGAGTSTPMARRDGPTDESRDGRTASPGRRRARHARAAYLRHDGPEHVLCFAPTRSGKGVGLVVPSPADLAGLGHRP